MELYQEMKNFEINELKSELPERKEASELISEEKTSEEVDIQFDFTVPTEGVYITFNS